MSLNGNLLPSLTSRLALTDAPAIKTFPERTASLEILRVLNNLTHQRNLSIRIPTNLKHFGYFTTANLVNMKSNILISALLPVFLLIACNKGPQDAVPVKETETMAKYKKGYQLYTIREELTNDSMLRASLISSANMGYVQVESFGYQEGTFWSKPKAVQKTIDSASLISLAVIICLCSLRQTPLNP